MTALFAERALTADFRPNFRRDCTLARTLS